MSDGLEINPTTGEASFVALRNPGWHGLGHVITEPASRQENMDKAKLSGWNVRLESVNDRFPDYNFYQDHNIVVRDNPFGNGVDVLGRVGGRYVILSNEDMFAFCDELLFGMGTWETMGSINGGTKVFGCMTLDMPDIVIDPQGAADVVKQYLMCSSAHDGTGSQLFGFTPVRLECQNTLNIAVRGLKTKVAIKHTPGAKVKRQDAQRILGISLAMSDALSQEANLLFQTECTNQQFDDIIRSAYPEPDAAEDGKASVTKWETKRDLIWDIYNGPTNTKIKGTAWGAFNALTERLDWHRAARKGDTENVFAAASGFDDVITKEKESLFYVVRDALVG